jgi:hypothetical protein
MRRHQIPGSAIRGPKFGKSYASGPGTSDVTPTCNLLPAGTCMKIGTLVLPGDMQVRQLLREPSIPNPSTPKDGMPMRPDVPLYLIWYLQRSGDMVTLDGETFLDLQAAPHQAEVRSWLSNRALTMKNTKQRTIALIHGIQWHVLRV